MRVKIYSLLMMILLLISTSAIAVNADTNSTNNSKITITKTLKINKTYDIKNVLKSKGQNVNDYTFSTSSKKTAKVSSNGIVKGINGGKATITVSSKTSNLVFAKVSVKVQEKKKETYNKNDLRYLSSIIFSEAGNQVYAGKQAVGIVVMNRVKSSRFPNTITGVLYQSGQFTPARNGSLSRSLSLYDSGKLNSDCIKAAKAVLSGDKSVSYGGRSINMDDYLFFSGYVSGCRLQIQGHQFK